MMFFPLGNTTKKTPQPGKGQGEKGYMEYSIISQHWGSVQYNSSFGKRN